MSRPRISFLLQQGMEFMLFSQRGFLRMLYICAGLIHQNSTMLRGGLYVR